MRYNRTKASRLTYAVCMYVLVVGYPLWLKLMTIIPATKYNHHKPFTSTHHVDFVHDGMSPFGNSEVCDMCDGDSGAVRFPVKVDVWNFTALDHTSYVVLYVAQEWHGKWWQASYPSILNPVRARNQTLDVCSVPSLLSDSPTSQPTMNPTHSNRRLQDLRGDDAGRRLVTSRLGDKLDDDFDDDDEVAALLDCCLGSPGQLYMVACVVRSWPGTKMGQRVTGPPFDDRCVAVSGVCGHTCGSYMKDPNPRCSAGSIPQKYLVSGYCLNYDDDECADGNDVDDFYKEQRDQIHQERNYFRIFGAGGWFHYSSTTLHSPIWHWSFITMMFMAYTSMVLAFLPGIGRCGSAQKRLPILHTLNAHHAIDNGVECVSFSISATEHKLWVLRNMVGKLASSFYHDQSWLTDYLQDETSRAGCYALWDALARFVGRETMNPDDGQDYNPDTVGFLKAWAARLRDPAELMKETTDKMKHNGSINKVLSETEKEVDPFQNIELIAEPFHVKVEHLRELKFAYHIYELLNVLMDRCVWTGWDVRHHMHESAQDLAPWLFPLYEWELGSAVPQPVKFKPPSLTKHRRQWRRQCEERRQRQLAEESERMESNGLLAVETVSPMVAAAGSEETKEVLSLSSQESSQKSGLSAVYVTHINGARDWVDDPRLSVFMVKWCERLLDVSSGKEGVDPFTSDTLEFALLNDSHQMGEELNLVAEQMWLGKQQPLGRIRQTFERFRTTKAHKMHDFLQYKEMDILFSSSIAPLYSRPLRMIYSTRGKPELKLLEKKKRRPWCQSLWDARTACSVAWRGIVSQRGRGSSSNSITAAAATRGDGEEEETGSTRGIETTTPTLSAVDSDSSTSGHQELPVAAGSCCRAKDRPLYQVKKRNFSEGVYVCLSTTSDSIPELPKRHLSLPDVPSIYPASDYGRISHWEARRRCYGRIKRKIGRRRVFQHMTNVYELEDLSSEMKEMAPRLAKEFQQSIEMRRKRDASVTSGARAALSSVTSGARTALSSVTSSSIVGLADSVYSWPLDTIELPEMWLEPQQRCRGKAGGLNFSVNILRQRERMELNELRFIEEKHDVRLYAIFDCRHMVTPGFWDQTILHFFRDYKGQIARERSVMYCQVPQHFVGVDLKTDYLDMQNEYLFRYVNCIRDGVGAVTSCGTNCVWAIDLDPEFEFEERTMIEDTATSHKVLLSGMEGTYHYEKLIFGTPKENKDFLAAVFRWSRGAVQLFFLSFFGGSQGTSGPFTFWGILLCTVGVLGSVLFGMQLLSRIEYALIVWVGFAITTAVVFWFLTSSRFASYLRYVVLLDNTTYFFNTIPAYYWCLVLPTFMCFAGSIPFTYYYFTLVPGGFLWEFITWMLIREVKGWSVVEGKRPREISILRSQQMYFVTCPLHALAMCYGALDGVAMLFQGSDGSSWSSFGDGGPGVWVVRWLTFLVTLECINILAAIIGIGTNGVENETFLAYLVGAGTALLFLALVYDPFCVLYFGSTKTITMKHAYLGFWFIMLILGILLFTYDGWNVNV